MSEYSKFLNYFNTKKGSQKKDGDNAAKKTGEAPAPAELTYIGEEEASEQKEESTVKEDVSFGKSEPRFIKQEAG